MHRLDTLTPAQESALETAYRCGLAGGTRTGTEPDRAAFSAGVGVLYADLGLPTPPIEWFSAPGEMLSRAAELLGSADAARAQLQVGQFWLSWTTHYLYLGDDLGLADVSDAADMEYIRALHSVRANCSYWVMLDGACLATGHPLAIRTTDDGVLHSLDSPSIEWPGECYYDVDGVVVPEWAIREPGRITRELIEREPNAELARAYRRIYGEGRWLAEVGAVVVDSEMVPTGEGRPALMRALMRAPSGEQWLVGSDGSTPRVYWMAVPSTVTTCRAAHEAISGVPDDLIEGRS